jgi:hypothetical protein
MSRSDRGLSAALGYILTLSITTLLISGLFITAGSVVDTQRQQATTQELTVHGERLAADLMTVDRLSENGAAVELEVNLPTSVGGSTYQIEITEERIELRSDHVDEPVQISFTADHDVSIADTDSISGGSVIIEFVDGRIEVQNG